MGLFSKNKKESEASTCLSDIERLEHDMNNESKRLKIVSVITAGANPPEILNNLFELGGYSRVTWPDVVKICEKYATTGSSLEQTLELHKRNGYYSG